MTFQMPKATKMPPGYVLVGPICPRLIDPTHEVDPRMLAELLLRQMAGEVGCSRLQPRVGKMMLIDDFHCFYMHHLGGWF